jgi:hypothetical protein
MEDNMTPREFAGAVAAAMGWTLVPATKEWHEQHPHIESGDALLWFSGGPTSREKQWTIHPEWPSNRVGEEFRPSIYSREFETVSSINVSVTKSPEQVAKDITRRLLPAYLPVLAAMVAQRDESDRYRAERLALATEVAGIVGGKVYQRGGNEKALHEVQVPYSENEGPRVTEVEFGVNHTLDIRVRGNVNTLQRIVELLNEQ